MARFRWRAPYFGSVPCPNRKSLTASVQSKTNLFCPCALKTRCCTRPNSMSRILRRCSRRKVLNTTTLSMRFMNSGENLRRAASIPVRSIFSSKPSSSMSGIWKKPRRPCTRLAISLAPKFEVMTMMHREKSTRLLSPRVSVPLSKIPSKSFHSASEAFSISSNSRIESFKFSVCHWSSTACDSNG